MELGMFLTLSGQSECTNQQISSCMVDWWHQTGLGGLGTCLTTLDLNSSLGCQNPRFQKCKILKNAIFEGPKKVCSRRLLATIAITFCRPKNSTLNAHSFRPNRRRLTPFWASSKTRFLAFWPTTAFDVLHCLKIEILEKNHIPKIDVPGPPIPPPHTNR